MPARNAARQADHETTKIVRDAFGAGIAEKFEGLSARYGFSAELKRDFASMLASMYKEMPGIMEDIFYMTESAARVANDPERLVRGFVDIIGSERYVGILKHFADKPDVLRVVSANMFSLAVPDASVSKKLERLLDGLSSQRIVAIINTIGNDPRTQDDAAVVANAICEAARVGGAPAAEKLGNLLLMVKNDTHLLNVMCSHDSAVFLAAAIGEDLAAERMAHSAMRG